MSIGTKYLLIFLVIFAVRFSLLAYPKIKIFIEGDRFTFIENKKIISSLLSVLFGIFLAVLGYAIFYGMN